MLTRSKTQHIKTILQSLPSCLKDNTRQEKERKYNTRSVVLAEYFKNTESFIPKEFKETTHSTDVFIDFDEASREWNKNKIKMESGMYRYKKSFMKKQSTYL